jgi:hypothetical protein
MAVIEEAQLKRAELIDERDGGLYAGVLDLVTL